MMHTSRFAFVFLLLSGVFSSAFAQVQLVESPDASTHAFPLVTNGLAAPIVVSSEVAEVVQIAARHLADDIQAVSGVQPEILPAIARGKFCVRCVIDPQLAGRWEAFRLSSKPDELTIAGSDPRGLAYGIYEVSRRIGVSPWRWWADVPAPRRSELWLSGGGEAIQQPAVKYRGIFINDEDWGLVPWAEKSHEPGTDPIGPKTYARVFELLLRLRGNTIWPGMHPTTTPFHQVPGNAEMADRFAIVVGSSHAEPMLRNNVGEWKAPKSHYNYLTHREEVLAYWEERVAARRTGESLFTLGMRGIHDSAIQGPKTKAERVATLQAILADQRALLAKHLGAGDPAIVGQIFCPYKEVLDDYEAGLDVPEDVTIVWPDDNFGYVRRFPTQAERERPGGLGVYYHLSYLGAPFSWLWVDSMPMALIWSEMTRAYEQGSRTLWLANVGDIKGQELSMEFFLDLAWNADQTSPETPGQFLQQVASRDFGSNVAEAIAAIWRQHQHLATARKPEHLQWHLPLTSYRPTTLTENEIQSRLHEYTSLEHAVKQVAAALPAHLQDAYFQRVSYPVGVAAAANQRYFLAELARIHNARGDRSTAEKLFADSQGAEDTLNALTDHYNDQVAEGKWHGIVQWNGMSDTGWRRKFQPARELPELGDNAPAKASSVASKPKANPPQPPHNLPAGLFYEWEEVVSMHAGHFNDQSTLATGAGWRTIQGLGRSGSAVTVLPSTATIPAQNPPSLSYHFQATKGGNASVRVRLLPTFPLAGSSGLRFALAIDQDDPIPCVVNSGFDTKSRQWKERVLANATYATCDLPTPITPGRHTLRLLAVDAGVVVDKIVINFGGLTQSYDGPPETRAQSAEIHSAVNDLEPHTTK